MTTSLSDSWRQNKSTNRVVELANSLRSLRKVIGSLNPEKCTVTYNSGGAQSFNNRVGKLIAIDPTYALKSAPINGNDFDVLVGLSVHEAMHTIVDSNEIPCDNDNMPKDIISPATIAVIGEEIYCDGYAKRHYGIPSKYIKAARNAYKIDVPIESWRKILLSWMNIALYNTLEPLGVPTRTTEALAILIPATTDLYAHNYNTSARIKIYSELFYRLAYLNDVEDKRYQDSISKLTSNVVSEAWADRVARGDGLSAAGAPPEPSCAGVPPTSGGNMPIVDDSGTGVPTHPNASASGAMGIEADPPMTDGNGIVPLHSNNIISPKLNAEISKALELDSEDITNQLKTIANKLSIPIHKNRMPVTILSNADTAIQVDFDKKLYDQLRWLDRLKNNMGKKILRHEERGRVDRAALYRAPIDGKVFRVTRQLPKQDIDMSILLDASNSMKDSTQVYDAAYAIHKVLPKVPIYSYSQYNTVDIIKHTVGNKFHKVKLGDTTPTGIAILATLNKHPKSLLFVFTDGVSNKGINPQDVFNVVPQEYPEAKVVYVVYRPGSRRQQLTTTRINNQVEQINISTVDEVPELMREALKPWFGVA
jgi:hypothetical protein